MATIVASRFAVLSVDDDDDDDDNLYPSKKKKAQNKKAVVKCSNPVVVKPDLQQKKKKKQDRPLQHPSAKKNSKSSSGTKVPNSTNESTEWEEWKQDIHLTEDNFEEQLSKAIFLSKLEYDKKKGCQDPANKIDEKQDKEKKKKRKSQKTVLQNELDESKNKTSPDPTIFKTTKTENRKKEKSEPSTSPGVNFKGNSAKKELCDNNSQESLTLVKYQASIDKKDREIEKLKAEIQSLSTQLKNVKTRNTKLCQIIASGEMKDKAEVLMEVERLQAIKDELSTEVANLHIQLEQERSKVRQLLGEHKTKNKKHQVH